MDGRWGAIIVIVYKALPSATTSPFAPYGQEVQGRPEAHQ